MFSYLSVTIFAILHFFLSGLIQFLSIFVAFKQGRWEYKTDSKLMNGYYFGERTLGRSMVVQEQFKKTVLN